MSDADFHELWHLLNEANVEVVLAHREGKEERRRRLAEALRFSRAAVGKILEVLSEREDPAPVTERPGK